MVKEINNAPTIGVVITSYNHELFIEDAIVSVLKQTVKFDEVLIVDDGSGVDCVKYVRDIASRYDIRVVFKDNAGVASARNAGLSQLTTDYVVFLDDDDQLSTRFVEWFYALVDYHECSVMCFDSTDQHEQLSSNTDISCLRNPRAFYSRQLLHYCPAASPGACVFRVADLKSVGSYDEGIWGADDFELLVKLGRFGSIVVFSEVLLFHRIHDNNASKSHMRMSLNIGKVLCKHYQHASLDELIRLSYWYGSYGPTVFIRSIVLLLITQTNKILILRLLWAYAAGRSIRRIS